VLHLPVTRIAQYIKISSQSASELAHVDLGSLEYKYRPKVHIYVIDPFSLQPCCSSCAIAASYHPPTRPSTSCYRGQHLPAQAHWDHVRNSSRRRAEGSKGAISNLSSAAKRQYCACFGRCWRWLTRNDPDVSPCNSLRVPRRSW
jgi:hypothetical protein